MAIKLNIEITSPMDARDHELLSGIAVMTLAIANHELAEKRFPEAFTENDQDAGKAESPASCGAVNPADAGAICVADAAHRGRHTFRKVGPGLAMAN
jgi:hypothetical protein